MSQCNLLNENINQQTKIQIEKQIVHQIKQYVEKQSYAIVAIDGRSASGKTTFADKLKDVLDAEIIHMDDFFLPQHLRTAQRLSEPGGNVHYERFRDEVLPFLASRQPFSYGVFNCQNMKIESQHRIGDKKIRIVEGAYSCHPNFGRYYDLRIFIDIDSKLQKERILKRNGQTKLQAFLNKWIPMEEAYIKAYGIRHKSDIVLCADNKVGF